AGIAAEIYPEAAKMMKQMEYANRRAIPQVAIVGSQELEAGVVTLKNMLTGDQRTVPFAELVEAVKNAR
ncbi:MAG: histidine--tRNA ligase, partial [Alistipes sp.]|nr:histidine--tRNA ligase [Alistipes sp.]